MYSNKIKEIMITLHTITRSGNLTIYGAVAKDWITE